MTYASGPYGYGYPPPPPPPKPGVIPLAPLGFGDILTGAFATYGRYWKPLVGVAVAAYAAAAALIGAALLVAWVAVEDDVQRLIAMPDGQSPDFSDVQPLIVAFVCVWLVAMVVYVVSSGLVFAAAPAVVQEAVLGRPIGFGAVWRRAWSRLGAVIGSVFLAMLATLVPMLLFMVGFGVLMAAMFASLASSEGSRTDDGSGLAVVGVLIFVGALALLPLALWLWIKFSLAPTVAVIEDQGPMASLRRSSALVKGSWWRVFGCTIATAMMVGMAVGLIQQVISQIGAIPMATIDLSAEPTPGEVFAAFGGLMVVLVIGQLVVQAVAAPFQPLVSSLLYVDQRIRRENLAQLLAQTAATPAP
ncbi:oxidoreductase [Streptomyces sp. NPDC012769]|uniref:oxidoreductase n=1 Tax=Streptomyces sp. NPDC012769 TaxID=3364848 RepID=UPI003676FBA5